ncbi:MAG: MFS transporter [Gemmatimonadaceae bacterium]
MTNVHDPYAALRNRDVQLYVSGRTAGVVGWQILQVALGWELYERTHSALALGLVGLATALPVVILALPAGHLADTVDRRRILIWAQVAFIITGLGLAAVSYWRGPVALVYVILLARGAVQAYNNPARQALLPQLVPPELFGNAVTWGSSAFQIASVVGPGLGGIIVAIERRATGAYLISTILIGLSLWSLIEIRGGGAASQTDAKPREKVTLRSIAAGMRFVRDTKVILAAITLDLFAVLLGGATALLPIFAKDILHVGPDGLGWLRAAPSVGALIVALAIAHRPLLTRTGALLLFSVAGFGISTIVFGLSRSFWLSMIMLFLLGAFDGVSMIIRSTLVQMRTPDEMRGRVSAVNSVFIDMSNELGGFESGALAALVGPVTAVVAGGVGTLIVVGSVALAWPELRVLGPLVEPVFSEPTIEESPDPSGARQQT